MSEKKKIGIEMPSIGTNGNSSEGLILYHDHFSFYSQKVVMALIEKNIKYESKTVNLLKSEQYKNWFLHLNPKGEVPVLQDTGKTIPGSGRIIDYLEDNFTNADTPKLIPMDQGPEIRQSVNKFRHILQQVPAGLLTTGAMLNPRLLKNPKVPFIAPVRKALANAQRHNGQKLREYAILNPSAREELLKKAAKNEEAFKSLSVESNFLAILRDIEQTIEIMDKELLKNKNEGNEDWWLCSKQFTVADVELSILLERICQLGLEYYFWSEGKRPLIEQYYQRVKQRDSYKKTIPGTLYLLKTILFSQGPFVLGIVATVALILSGVFLAKRFIH